MLRILLYYNVIRIDDTFNISILNCKQYFYNLQKFCYSNKKIMIKRWFKKKKTSYHIPLLHIKKLFIKFMFDIR